MRWLLSLLLFMPFTGRSVEWPYIGSEVETNGWVLRLTLSTSPDLGTAPAVTNLNFFNGFLTNSTPSYSNMLALTVTMPGFDENVESNRNSRIVYGTTVLRLAGSLWQTNDIIAEQLTNAVLRIALSGFVMAGDVVTINALAGAVASTNLSAPTNSAAFSASVTNSSTLPWLATKSIANWSYPGLQLITNDTLTLRAIGFHRSGQQGRPLRAVKFIALDEHSNAITNIQTEMQIDWSMGDANPIPEYIGKLNLSTFTNGDVISCHFEAIPFFGDTTAIRRTTDNVNSQGPNYAVQYNRLDRLGTYGSSYALVDPSGSSTGVCGSNTAAVVWQSPFDSIGHALDALTASNRLWFGNSRSNHANSTIFLCASNGSPSKFNWTGNNANNGNPYANPALVITHYPTNIRTDATLANGLNYSDASCRRHVLRDVVIGFTNNGFYSDRQNFLWADRCTFSVTEGGMFSSVTNGYYTSCVFSNLPVGFGANGHAPTLIRGNWFYNTNDLRMRTYTQIGNRRMTKFNAALGQKLVETNLGGDVPQPDGAICAYNYFGGLFVGSTLPVNFYGLDPCANGGAFVCNVVENFHKDIITHIADFALATTNCTNLIIADNNFVGGPVLFGFNDAGTVNAFKVLWRVINNTFDNFGRSDLEKKGTNTGNWAVMHAVDWAGNANPINTNNSVYDNTGFDGLRSLNSKLQQTNWHKWSSMGSAIKGVTSLPGLGDYRLQSASPDFRFTADWFSKFDMDGKSRSAIDPPGAYTAGNAKKGSHF